MNNKLLLAFLVPCFFFCASPGHFMSNAFPQKNIPAREYGDSKASRRVLICGVTSPFKEAVITSIVDSLTKESVYVKTIRLKGLRKIRPTEWNAMLIFDKCMAWEMDFNVKKYVKKFPEYGAFIVITTSGEPECGSTKQIPKNIDAIATASVNQKIPEVVAKTLALLKKKID